MRDKINLWWRYYTDRYPYLRWHQINSMVERWPRVRYNNKEFYKMKKPAWLVQIDVLFIALCTNERDNLTMYDQFYLSRFPWRQVTALHMDQITRRLEGKDTIHGE